MLPLLLLFASVAGAALIQHGDLFVAFDGNLSPTTLPRHNLAPISVNVSGRVRTPQGTHPPPLEQMTIALNRNGVLDTTGLPTCRLSQLQATNSARALALCRPALVGRGTYVAAASFPEQSSFPAVGHVLAFNAKSEGRPSILAQVSGAEPVPSTAVITFYIKRPRGGPYGTLLNATLPTALQGYGYIKHLNLSLHRRFTFKGRRRSYLSAACATPAGVPVASFPFAHISMRFEGGVVLGSTLTRSCRVRR